MNAAANPTRTYLLATGRYLTSRISRRALACGALASRRAPPFYSILPRLDAGRRVRRAIRCDGEPPGLCVERGKRDAAAARSPAGDCPAGERAALASAAMDAPLGGLRCWRRGQRDMH